MLKKPVWAVLFSAASAALYLAVGKLLGRAPFFSGTPWGGPAAELVLALLAALALLALGKGRVLTDRGRGFGAGMAAGGFMTGYLTLALLGTLALWQAEPMGSLEAALFILYMLAIGLAEELTFRGLIQNVLADAFGRDSRRGVWLTVCLSGLIFGLVHLGNILSGVSPAGAAMQALAAAGIGIYLGAVYIRCGNIWAPVLLHGFNDLVGMLSAAGGGEGTAVEAISGYGPEKLLTVGLYIALTAFLLRRKKLDGILEKGSGPV